MSKEVNATNNQQLIDVLYMPISREDEKAMGYKPSELVVRHIGVKNVTCIQSTRYT